MDNDDYKEIKDAIWQQIDSGSGEIKFIRNNKRRKLKIFLKGVAFMLIAIVSGGAAGAYIVEKKISSADFPYNSAPFNFFGDNNNASSDIPKNTITKVAEAVGPAIVGVSNKIEGSFGEADAGSGSGIIFDSRGYIVTNNHVINGADKITVKLSNGKVFNAKYVGSDTYSDLAVIKIDAKYLPTARFGDSSKVRVGDIAVAIGNPLGEEFAGTVTTGIICAVNRKYYSGKNSYKLLQTDAAINPGNSGGALCNEDGEVIGINSLRLGSSSVGNIEGLGFAISINEAKTVIQTLMKDIKQEEGKNESKPSFGIKGTDAKANQNNGLKGTYINEVESGSAADKAGIKAADIIIQADDIRITRLQDIDAFLCSRKAGDTVVFKIWRQGDFVEVKVLLT